MGKPALRLDLNTERDKKNQYYEGNCFAYTKVPTNQISYIHGIESLNFKLIDTNLTYEMSIKRIPKELNVSDGYSIRFAQPDDRKKIGDISEKSFGFSRFHLDPLVCNKTANQIKRAWAENYFKGERGEFMVVALTDKHPVGFTQVLVRGDTLIIDLIAVQSSHHGQGFGGAMISFLSSRIQERYDGVGKIRVGTQIANFPAISLYEKMGFSILSSDYVFHHHGKLELES